MVTMIAKLLVFFIVIAAIGGLIAAQLIKDTYAAKRSALAAEGKTQLPSTP